MPDDKEVLGFSLEFTTKAKGLENVKKMLDGTLKDIDATTKAIKRLNQLFGAWSGLSTINKNRGNTEEANRYKEMAKNAKVVRDSLKVKLDAEKALLSTTKIPSASKEKVGEKVFDSKDSAPEIGVSKDIRGELVKKVTTFGEDNEFVEEFYKEINDTVDKITETVIKTKSDEIVSTTEKYKKKSTYDPASFEGIGKVISTKVDALTKDVIQTTEERIGDLVNKRIYKNGVLDKTTTYYKPLKKEAKEKTTPTTGVAKIVEKLNPKAALDEKKTKTSFSRFTARVKNIVFYRVVRVAMSAITKGINEGFSLLSTSNGAFKDILVDFKTESMSLSVTFAQLLAPAAQVLSSSLKGVTADLIAMSNAMSLNEARAKGETQYFKLSQEAIDEYSKSLVNANKSLTELDKFATLSENKPLLGTWETITDETVENSQQYSLSLETIYATIKVVSKVFKGFIDMLVWINNLSTEWKVILGAGITAALIAIGIAASPITAIITSIIAITTALYTVWSSDMPKAFKIATTVAIGLAAVLAVVAALMPSGLAKVTLAVGAGAATLTALGGVIMASENREPTITTPTIDTGNSVLDNSALNNYTNGLEGGKVADFNDIEPQASTSIAPIILDGHAVGKAIATTVYSFGNKNGKW